MSLDNLQQISEGLTYDDVLLAPAYSEVLPREVSLKSKFTRNITVNTPIVSAAMDTVTEAEMAIAMAAFTASILPEGNMMVLRLKMKAKPRFQAKSTPSSISVANSHNPEENSGP